MSGYYSDDVEGSFVPMILVGVMIIFFAFIFISLGMNKKEEHTPTTVVDTVKVVQKVHDTIVVDAPKKSVSDKDRADLIFYKIPVDRLLEYAALQDVWKKDKLEGWDCYNNQKAWDWLRKLFGRDFEPYKQDGIYYTWCIVTLNSNTICVVNSYLLDFTEEELMRKFVDYMAEQ